jgi:hypothetical protein
MEVGDERAKLVAHHALGQADLPGTIIGTGGFGIAFKIEQVRAVVEPDKGIFGGTLDLLKIVLQGALPIALLIPIFAKKALQGFLLLRALNEQIEAIEGQPVGLQRGIGNFLIRAMV